MSWKLSKLRGTSSKIPNYTRSQPQLDNFMHNVAEADLTVTELGLLNKGLNYVHLPSTTPMDDIIVGVDSALKLVLNEDSTSIKSCCKYFLSRVVATSNNFFSEAGFSDQSFPTKHYPGI
jgi:hypothetical protein